MTSLDPSSRAAWLDWRRGGIGGSDIASVARIEGAFGTPFAVWLSKVHNVDGDATEPMLWGSLIEDVILNEVGRRVDAHIGARQRRLVHPEATHHRATLDGAAFASPLADLEADGDLEAAVAGIEAKVTWERAYRDRTPPLRYWAQAQWQMWCGNMDRVLLAVLHQGTRLELYEIPRSDDDIDFLVDAADRFWTDYVLPAVPPPFEADDVDLVRSWVGRSDNSTLVADPDTISLLSQLHAAQAALRRAEDVVATFKANLMARVGTASLLVAPDGTPLASFKASRTFDLAAAIAAHPEAAAGATTLDVDAFKKAIGRKAVDRFMVLHPDASRRLTLKKEPTP